MTCPDELVHLYSAFGLLVALHTIEIYLPSITDILFCDDVLNVGLSRSGNKHNNHTHYTVQYCLTVISLHKYIGHVPTMRRKSVLCTSNPNLLSKQYLSGMEPLFITSLHIILVATGILLISTNIYYDNGTNK